MSWVYMDKIVHMKFRIFMEVNKYVCLFVFEVKMRVQYVSKEDRNTQNLRFYYGHLLFLW